MLDPIWLALIIGGLGCLLILARNWLKFSKLPPGPSRWPLVGNAFQMDPDRPHITWSEWAEEYGPVYTVSNFGTPVVMCNSFEAIWQMMVIRSTEFAGRPSVYPSRYLFDDSHDIGFCDFTPEWVRRKKVFMTCMKMYGDGLKRLEDIMEDIIDELIQDLRKTEGQPFDIKESIQFALANTLSLLLLGNKFERDDPEFHKLVVYIAKANRVMAPCLEYIALDAFPLLHYLPLKYCQLMNDFVKGFIQEWLPKQIDKRKMQYDRDNIGCVMDAFLRQKELDQEQRAELPITNRNIVAMSADFIEAGMNTSGATLYSLFAVITAQPQVQAKAQKEVDMVLGKQRPTLKDKGNMPYMEAMIEEVLRYAVIIPGLQHKATTDSQICGHFIPKGTEVFPNIWILCHDSEFWGDPWVFRPERFLDEDGQFLPPEHPSRKRVLVFGAGRRVCPGEVLARNRIFLIMASLLQHFTLVPASDDHLPQHDPRTYIMGLQIMPQPYQLRTIPRD